MGSLGSSYSVLVPMWPSAPCTVDFAWHRTQPACGRASGGLGEQAFVCPVAFRIRPPHCQAAGLIRGDLLPGLRVP